MNIEKIYELMYSPIVTPWNLLDNVKLDHYEYVNYFKEDNFIIAEMKFINSSKDEEIFQYYFDHDDKLLMIYRLNNAMKEVMFDRKSDLAELLNGEELNKKII